MFLRGQTCLGRRLAVTFDTVAAGPDEPLLFLYPRWVTSAPQRRRPITTLSPPTGPAKINHAYRASVRPIPCSLASSSCQPSRWNSTQNPDDDSSQNLSQDTGMRHGKFFTEDRRSYNPFADIENAPSDLSFQISNPQISHPRVSSPQVWKPQTSSPQVSKPQEPSKGMFFNKKLARWESLRAPSLDSDSIESDVNGLWEMPLATRKKLLHERHYRLDLGINCGPLDWDGVPELLESVQDDPRAFILEGDKQEGIEIPHETALLLSGNTADSHLENIWFIHVRTGCRVHLLDAKEANSQRRVILSGSDHAIELVKQRIRHVNNLLKDGDPLVHRPIKLPLPVIEERETLRRNRAEVPLIHAVWSEPQIPAREPEDIPEPLLYTVKDFAEYVEDLTLTPQPPKRLSNHKIPHSHLMARKITRLFQKEENQKLFSSGALNTALRFLCRSNQLLDSSVVFAWAQPFATVETYNILLRSMAQTRNVKRFRKYLQMMPRAHILPNSGTWLALLEALTTPSAKASLVTRMAQRGHMKDTDTLRRVLRFTLQDSLSMHLNSGENIESFMALMVKAIGPDWFSSETIGQIFQTAARIGDFKTVDQFLKICLEHSLPINNSSLDNILTMCNEDVHMAFHYALQFLKHPGFIMERGIKEHLFFIAFKSCSFNLCRVMWYYCCLEGCATGRMRQEVKRSLRRAASWKGPSTDRSVNDFLHHFGRVVIGIDLKDFDHEACSSLPAEFRDKPLDYLSVDFAPRENRSLQRDLIHAVVDHDYIDGPQTLQPMFSLSIMLEAAARIDSEWQQECKDFPGKYSDLFWLTENAIQVPLTRKAHST